MLAVARALRYPWRQLRFRLWVAGLRLRLLAAGARLRLESGRGIVLDGLPRVLAYPAGEGGGVLTLRIGEAVHLGRNTTIELDARGDNELTIGGETLVMDGVRFVLRSGTISIGRRCNIRDGVWLKSDGELSIGDHVPVAQGSAIHCTEEIRLEDYVGLAERVTVLDSDHSADGSDVYFRDQPVRVDPVRLERNTFVAANAVLMRGTRIGRNSVVAAGAVVRGDDYPAASLIAGNPAKRVRTLAPAADDGPRSRPAVLEHEGAGGD